MEFQIYPLVINKGIKILETISYFPQQNGVAERFDWKMQEKVRALLLQSDVPKILWIEALYSSVFVINRIPTRVLEY